MADIVLQKLAFVKPLLHAAKYPHCGINGVFLAENQKQKVDKLLKIVDAIPLFHSTLTLAPMAEVALSMIDSYCQTKGLIIAGYYQANENLSDASPAGLAYHIAEKIRDNCSDACLLMIDNAKVFSDDDHAYNVYAYADGKWKKSDRGFNVEKASADIASTLIQSRLYRDLIDFDNHLDDISLDWRNVEINDQIAICN